MLTRITLESSDRKQWSDATGLMESMKNYEFIVFIAILKRLLTAMHKASLQLQNPALDLSFAMALLSMALGELKYLCQSWTSIILTTNTVASAWNIIPGFNSKRIR